MKEVLVIGGSGFVGSHTCDALSEAGYKVTIFDKLKSEWITIIIFFFTTLISLE